MRSRVPGTFSRLRSEEREFMSALLAAHKSRGIEGADGRLDPGIVDEVVLERYGGWTGEATRMVNRVEQRTRRVG